MRPSFRTRVFLAMVGLGTVPLAVALLVLALQARSSGSPTLDDIARSGRELVTTVDTTALTPAGREALRAHTETLARRTQLARRAEALSRATSGVLGVVILAVAVLLIATSLWLARRWARDISNPIEELVTAVGRVQRGQAIDHWAERPGAPEFDSLRRALHEMSVTLQEARRRDRERERLQAFRETARNVAHEMRGPLTSAGLALRQLERHYPGAETGALAQDVRRLQDMAHEFSEFGRLPEGPEASIDVGELLESVAAALSGAGTPIRIHAPPDLVVLGHYEPLRRAMQNVVRNAIEASPDGSTVEIAAHRLGNAATITVADQGPGIPDELRERVFEPYFTTKTHGTGLGLALARQTVCAHGGNIEIVDTQGGGATFVITLPSRS